MTNMLSSLYASGLLTDKMQANAKFGADIHVCRYSSPLSYVAGLFTTSEVTGKSSITSAWCLSYAHSKNNNSKAVK